MMHPKTKNKIKHLQGELKTAKVIIGKRNDLFHKLRWKITDPVFTALLFLRVLHLFRELFPEPEKYSKKHVVLADYFILVMARGKMVFGKPEAQEVIDNLPEELKIAFANYQKANTRLETLVQFGYLRSWQRGGKKSYNITTDGKSFLLEMNEKLQRFVTDILKQPTRFAKRESLQIQPKRRRG